MTERLDVAIVGGGPAGLHAALKAALLYRTAVLFDRGRKYSRIYWTPHVANIPGRYNVSGRELVVSGYDAIEAYQEDIGRRLVTVHEDTEVTSIERLQDGGFRLKARGPEGEHAVEANAFVLATGVTDAQPRLGDFRRRDIEAVLPYANKGLADYCLLCDGHTVEDKRVAVLGCDPGSRKTAKSLKANFGADTVIVPFCNTREEGTTGPMDPQAPWAEVEEDLAKWEIPILYGAIKGFTGIQESRFGIEFEDRPTEWFDKAWISMGWYSVQSGLAEQLGAALDEDGFVKTDPDGRMLDAQGDVISDAYAIGDVRSGSWKQIPVAWGQAEAAVIDAFVTNRRQERLS